MKIANKFFIVWLCLFTPCLWAAEAPGGFSFLPPKIISASYSGWYIPQADPVDVQQHRLSLQVPFYREAEETIWGSGRAGLLHFGQTIVLPVSGIVVPKDWWSVEFGGQYTRRLQDKKMAGLRFSVGSASDVLFAGADEATYTASLFYSFPAGDHGSWLLLLNYTNNSSFLNNIPVPGFAYSYRSPHFNGLFGFPFLSMEWTPTPFWSLSASALGPTKVRGEIAYGTAGHLQPFVGFDWGQIIAFRDGRANGDDRLFYDEKRLLAGLRSPLVTGLAAELQGGYAFNRAVFEAESYFDDAGPAARLDDAWFAGWQVKLDL